MNDDRIGHCLNTHSASEEPKEKLFNEDVKMYNEPSRWELFKARLFGKKVESTDFNIEGSCTIVGYSYKGVLYVTKVKNCSRKTPYDKTYKFRPIQPERDKLINKGEQDIKSLNPELDREVIARLVDAGWRPSAE